MSIPLPRLDPSACWWRVFLVSCRCAGFLSNREFSGWTKNSSQFPPPNDANRQNKFSVLTLASWLLNTDVFHHRKLAKYFRTTTLKSKCPSKNSWIKPPCQPWFEPTNQRTAWLHGVLTTHALFNNRCAPYGRPAVSAGQYFMISTW